MTITIPYSQFFTKKQGEEFSKQIEPEINKQGVCIIDFINVQDYAISAVNGLFSDFKEKYGPEFINEFIVLQNEPKGLRNYI